jgi:RNA polymerase subunit RPABC4/transcription elongation factor Spt4
LLLPIWVFLDARKRKFKAPLWGILTLVTNIAGLIIYLTIRPEPVSCTNCGELLNTEFVTCPYCGTVNRDICPNCKKVISKEWNVCPYCSYAIEKEIVQKLNTNTNT